MKQGVPDQRWFKSLFESRGYSQRQVAKALGIDPAALSLVLVGKRKLKSEEAAKLAKEFQLPLEDVLKRAGVAVPEVESAQKLRVAGWLDDLLKLHPGVPKGPKVVPCPFPDPHIRVARIQVTGPEYAALDGALVFYQFRNEFDPSSDLLGRPCIVTFVAPEGAESALRYLRRGYSMGTYNLTNLTGMVMESEVELLAAYPVIGIQF